MTNHPFLTLLFIGAMLWSVENRAKAADLIGKEQQLVHTLKPGSPEREAICDGARRYVLSKYVFAALPQPIIFKINHVSVQEPFCNLEAIALLKDGSDSTDYISDIVFNFCMKETAGTWEVTVDLSRTDVPDTSELRQIRRDFPKDFPLSLMSPNWRQRLQQTSGSAQDLGSQEANDAEVERVAKVRVAAREAEWAAAGISLDFVTAGKMAKSGYTAKQINEELALEHRHDPNRPQMHPAERAELAKYYGIQINPL